MTSLFTRFVVIFHLKAWEIILVRLTCRFHENADGKNILH